MSMLLCFSGPSMSVWKTASRRSFALAASSSLTSSCFRSIPSSSRLATVSVNAFHAASSTSLRACVPASISCSSLACRSTSGEGGLAGIKGIALGLGLLDAFAGGVAAAGATAVTACGEPSVRALPSGLLSAARKGGLFAFP
eukprot:625527-Prymnesium_polylepis.2